MIQRNKIHLLILSLVMLIGSQVLAQTNSLPDGIIFQAVATDPEGNPAAGRTIYIKDAILQSSATGQLVFSETFQVTASASGVFTIVIGKGQKLSGSNSIKDLDWSAGPYFFNIKAAVAPSLPLANWKVDEQYVDMGTSQFWSVPFALYASKVAGLELKLSIADTTNMLKPYLRKSDTISLSNRIDGNVTVLSQETTRAMAAETLKANVTDVTTSLALKENVANKSTTASLGTSDVLYPTQNAVKTYVDAQIASGTIADADANTKGKIQLAGDLGGTASSPTVLTVGGSNAYQINAATILANAATNSNTASTIVKRDASGNFSAGTIAANLIGNVTGNLTGNVIGDVTGNASNVTGTVAVVNGGTGATTLTGYIKGNGSNAFTTISTIPSTDITGLVTKVNGSSPGADGNVSIVFGHVTSGILSTKPADGTGTNGDIYVVSGDATSSNNGRTFIYDGTTWNETNTNQAATDARYLQLAGGTLSGNLVIPTTKNITLTDLPNSGTDAVNKNYVDTKVSSATISDATVSVKGKLQLAGDLGGTASSPRVLTVGGSTASNINAATDLSNAATNSNTASTIVKRDASGNFSAGTIAANLSGNVIGDVTGNATNVTGTVAVVNGGTGATTLTGYIKGNGSNSMNAVSTIPSTHITGLITKVNGTLPDATGNVSIIFGHVTSGLFSSKPADGTGTNGDIYVVSGDATSSNNGRTFIYDGTTWNEINTNQATTDARYLQLAGGTLSGNLVIPTAKNITLTDAPSSGTDAVNKNYVDTKVSSATISDATVSVKGKLQLAGDLGGTADAPSVPGLALKANTVDVTNSLVLKANTSDVTTSLALKANIASPTFTGTVSGIDKTMVGLSNVDNTSDASKPISIATQTALDTKENTINKSTSIVTDATSDVKYPSVKAVKNYLDSIGVPYTGATMAVNLGAYDLTVNGLTIGKGLNAVSNNTAIGISSLSSNTTGNDNTANGFESLKNNTIGFDNAAFGSLSLRTNQNGARNTALGRQSLYSTNGANDNTAVGYLSLRDNTTGGSNVAVGSQAMILNTTAAENTALGANSMYNNTTGSGNIAIGFNSLSSNSTGGGNSAVGHKALTSNTTSTYNSAFGVQSLEQNTTGSINTAIGVAAIDRNSTGSNNAVLGAFAGRYIGDGATYNTEINNTVLIGVNSKPLADHGINEIVIGYNAIGNGSNTVQLGNTDITNVKTSGTITAGGVTYPKTDGTSGQVLTANANGLPTWQTASSSGVPYTGATGAVNLGAYDLTVNGLNLGLGGTSQASNTAIGYQALKANTDGNSNTALGYQALNANTTGNSNTALGYQAMHATTSGGGNIAIGMNAMVTNTIGQQNTAIGQSALNNNSNASANVAIGNSAGAEITTGGYNTIIGTESARGLSTGSGNTIIGRYPYTGNISNSIVLSNGWGEIKAQHDGTSWTLGTIGSGTWNGSAIGISYGGTGATTKAAAFDALSPMTTSGDILYGATSGTGTRLAKGTDGQVLTLAGGLPSWSTPSTTATAFSGILPAANGGTGIDNTGKTITLGGNFTTSGAYATTFSSTGTTSVTLPLSGTLATLDGTETLANKTLTTPVIGVASGTSLNLSSTFVSGAATFNGTIKVVDGTEGAGKVLTSDASGNASWQTASGGSGTGTVTSVATGTGLTGGPITTSGTLSLANTAVTSGSYTRANITVDAQGRLTAADNGAPVNLTSEVSGVLPLANGGTNATDAAGARSNLGLGTAALANTGTAANNIPVLDGSGKIPNTLLSLSGLSYKGNYSLSGNPTVTVEASGNYYIISVAGTETVSGLTFAAGDWMISNGAAWQKISNSSAVSSVAGKTGVVTLTGADITSGTVAIVNGGTGATTKAAAFDALSPMTASGDILYGGTSGTGTRLAKGTDGQFLKLASGLPTWATAITSVNGLTVGTQTFATSTTGNDFTISSATSTHTFNLPDASATARGLVTTGTQTFAGAKTFSSDLIVNGITIGMGAASVSSNTAVGYNTLNENTTGVQNTATGYLALWKNTTGQLNTATGQGAAQSNTTGTGNTVTGAQALSLNTSGSYNVSNGYNSLYSNTTGSWNVGIGEETLIVNTTGLSNTALGVASLHSNTTGNYNIGIGNWGLSNITTGSSNTAIGNGANVSSGDLTNTTAIGNGALVSASNTIRLGNSAITSIGGQVGWTAASDIRIKKNISNTKYGLATVMQLRAVDYNLISNNLRQVGFIAQEVKKLVPEVVTGKEGDIKKGEILGITYANLVPVLTKAIQEQQSQIEEQKKRIDALELLVKQLIKSKN